jgi:uncharacterized membrane protein
VTWLRRYQLRHFLRFSFWLVPVVWMVAGIFTLRTMRYVDERTGWTWFGYSADGARQLLGGLSSSMLTFIVFAVSALLLALQLASSQLTPRIIATAFSSRVVQMSIGAFVFVYTFTLGAVGRIEDHRVPQLTVALAITCNLVGMVLFFWFVSQVGATLRPVAVLQYISEAGQKVVDAVYPRQLDEGSREMPSEADALSGPPRVIEHARASGSFLAFGMRELVRAAQRADCVIEIVPEVGNFVARGEALFRVYPAECTIDTGALSAMVAFGPERTLEQDPAFAFRIIVDIASRALSPAINDPTTAVLALDQIHRLLWHVGRKQLDSGRALDGRGRVRLLYPTPRWEDFVALGVTEIRHFGASSIQVARRLRALLEHLMRALPESRTPPLHVELAMLQRSVGRAYPEAEDRRRAEIGDLQGIGGVSIPQRPDRD